MKTALINLISKQYFIYSLYIFIAVGASLQAVNTPIKPFEDTGYSYNSYNNYTIFQQSFFHLKNQQDLYVLYPEEHWDLYKYTPTFSVFFGVFATLPDWLGLTCWNLLNVLLLLYGIYLLPKFTNFQKGLMSLLILFELITSIQNEQSNGLMAGLLVLTFALLEHKKYFFACLCIIFSVYIKLFGVVGFALFLFYPNKLKLTLYCLFWTIVLFLLPLFFVDFTHCFSLFKSYWNMLSHDHSTSYGFSVMGIVYTWFKLEHNKSVVVLLGALLYLLPFIKIRYYDSFHFRLLALASTLIWIVIFNHKGESPTYIIAFMGAVLWFMISKKNNLNVSLFIFGFIGTSLLATDLFPKTWQDHFFEPYVIKSLPCILIWFKIIYDMSFSSLVHNESVG